MPTAQSVNIIRPFKDFQASRTRFASALGIEVARLETAVFSEVM